MSSIDRCGFLQSPIALSARIYLPVKATRAQVNEVSEQVLRDPWFFKVSEGGAIVEPDEEEPQVNSDIYDISVAFIHTPDELIDEVDRYDELRSHFQQVAADELELVEGQLDDDAVIGPKRKRLDASPDGAAGPRRRLAGLGSP